MIPWYHQRRGPTLLPTESAEPDLRIPIRTQNSPPVDLRPAIDALLGLYPGIGWFAIPDGLTEEPRPHGDDAFAEEDGVGGAAAFVDIVEL